jgi:four helix bundle protein
MTVNSYRELIVWQKAMQLAQQIYDVTEQFPKAEMYGLTAQMRRCAISIPSNIAEGYRRGTRRDYRSFLLNAYGSGAELETQVELSKNLPFGSKLNFEQCEKLLDEVMRMLNRITSQLKIPA